mgnify:CR=1 FL=1
MFTGVGKIFPGSGHTLYFSLSTQFAFCSHFTGNTGYLKSK